MALQDFCQHAVVTITPERPVTEACEMMRHDNIGCVLVTEEDGQLLGILTDRDIALRVTGEGRNPHETKVRDIMTPDPVRIPTAGDAGGLWESQHLCPWAAIASTRGTSRR